MPSDLESDVVVVQTNHGLIFEVPVPPQSFESQSFEESRSNTLEAVPTAQAGSAGEAAANRGRAKPALPQAARI